MKDSRSDKANPLPVLESSSLTDHCEISVIIPALNEEKVIRLCLEALTKLDFPRTSMEVILVDNGSTDQTIEIVRSYCKVLNLRILERRGVYISALRNTGASQARGEILAFLDADCIVPPGWLSNGLRLLSDLSAGVAGAHYEIPADSTWVGRAWYQDRTSEKVGNVRYIPSGDLFIRRDTFIAIGGFDETIQTNEDFELCQRVLGAGRPVRSYPELRVVHLGTPRTLGGFYRKQRWHGTHVLTVFFRNIRKGHNARPVLFSFYTLLCMAGVAFGLVRGLAWGYWKICAVSAAALLIPLFLIALVRSASKGTWLQIFPTTCLYLAFGVARASCLLNLRVWVPRKQSVSHEK